MELFALLFAIAAGLAFLYGLARPPHTVQAIAGGLTLLTVAWILQTVVLTGWHWVAR